MCDRQTRWPGGLCDQSQTTISVDYSDLWPDDNNMRSQNSTWQYTATCMSCVSTFLHCLTLTWNTQQSLRDILLALPHITIRTGSGVRSLSGWWRLTAEWRHRAPGQLGPPPVIVVHICRWKTYSMERVQAWSCRGLYTKYTSVCLL